MRAKGNLRPREGGDHGEAVVTQEAVVLSHQNSADPVILEEMA
jgi:hypothetical protein